MLILAAAADPKMDAARRGPVRRSLDDTYRAAFSEPFLVFNNLDLDLFARQDERDKDRASIRQATHAVAAVDQFLHCDLVGLRHFHHFQIRLIN